MEPDDIDSPLDRVTFWKIVKIAALTVIGTVAVVVVMIVGWSSGWFE